jgi:PleD family two-component response regulator
MRNNFLENLLLGSFRWKQSFTVSNLKSEVEYIIYVLDDCIDTLGFIKRSLEVLPNVTIRTFHDEFDFIKASCENTPDLFICDLHLSTLDGIQVCEVLRDISPYDITTLYISADQNKISKIDSLLTPAISKPLVKETFIKKVLSITDNIGRCS